MEIDLTKATASKPTQYVLRFIAKISWEGQANGLPPEIYAFLIYEGNDTKQINDLIENQIGAFIRMQSFICQQDQGKMIDMRETPAERMLVPFKWIVNITTDIHLMGAEMSNPDEQGIERLNDGSEPVKQ